MAWKQILTSPQLTSEIFDTSLPFTIRAEGTFTSHQITIESSRREADIWNPVDLNGQLTATNPQATFGSNPESKYRVSVDIPGLNIFYNAAYPVQGA